MVEMEPYGHDDVIKWKHSPRYWPFVRGIHRSPLMFSLICTWTHGYVNNRDAGDLRRHRAHYDVTVITIWKLVPESTIQHIMPCMNSTRPLDIYMLPSQMGEEARPQAAPVGLKVEQALTSAEMNAELVCPLGTPNFPPGTRDYDPRRHDLIEGVKVVITWLRIGHTKATKSHILSRGPSAACHHCGQTPTVKHRSYAPGVCNSTGMSWRILHSWLIEYTLRDNSRDMHSGIPARSGILLSDMTQLTSINPQTWTI